MGQCVTGGIKTLKGVSLVINALLVHDLATEVILAVFSFYYSAKGR